MQFADTVFPMLGWPDTVGRVLLGLLALGFPVAIGLSWAFDLGPEGIRRTGAVDGGAAGGTIEAAGAPASRTWALVAVGASLGAILVWGLPRVMSGGAGPATDSEISRDVIAVMPFAVTGAPELEYLSEGLVNLVGDRLDGAGPLRVVDPRAVLGGTDFAPGDGVDPERAAALARELGAGRFVTGSLVGLPGRVTLNARLHDTDVGSDEPALVSTEGSAEALPELVDQLATGLLANSISGANARIQRSAAQSSRSPEATKEFLRGEQFHRRGQFDSAATAYNRALSHDSTFALAHLMKSMNNAYTYETDDYAAAVKAMEYAADLPDRDRSLILAFMNQQSGRLTEAEGQYLAHLKRWPDEVKALLMLGMLYQRSNPRWARPIEQARPFFDGVLRLEPENVAAMHNLARIDAGSRRYGSLPARAVALQNVAPDSEWAVDAQTMAAFALGDSVEIQRLLETFPEQSLLVRLYAVYNALRFSPDLSLAEQLLDRQASQELNTDTGLPDYLVIGDDLSISEVVSTDLLRGRYDEVRAFLVDPPSSAVWQVWTGELVVADVVPVDRALTEQVLSRLQAIDPVDRLRNPFEPLHDVFSVELATIERDFTAAKLLARLGRIDEAWAIQRRIAEHPPLPAFESMVEDVSGALAADLYVLEGDRERALEVLRTLPFQLPLTAQSLSVSTGSHARHLRAELELELGDPEAARYLYAGLVESFAPPDKLFLANAYARLGQIHERAGRTEEAVYYYDRFVKAWANADPELGERRSAVQARLDALR